MSAPPRHRLERKIDTFVDDGALAAFVARFDANARALGFSPDAVAGAATYPVRSLYFDAPDFACAALNAAGDVTHVKFRLRRYGDGALFYELKARRGPLGEKPRRRAAVFPRSLDEVRAVFLDLTLALTLEGGFAFARPLVTTLVPTAIVGYTRSAYQGPGDERVCLDRGLTFAPGALIEDRLAGDAIRAAPPGLAVVELKGPPGGFTRRALSLVGTVDRPLRRFSKYCEAIACLAPSATDYEPHPRLRDAPRRARDAQWVMG